MECAPGNEAVGAKPPTAPSGVDYFGQKAESSHARDHVCPPGVALVSLGGSASCRRGSLTHGKTILNYNDGRPRQIAFASNGSSTGVWTRFHPNGQKYLVKTFVGGKEHGLTRGWTRDGTLQGVRCLQNGEEVWVVKSDAEAAKKTCP